MNKNLRMLAVALLAVTGVAHADVDPPSFFISGTVGAYPVIGELTVHSGNAIDGYYKYTHSDTELQLHGDFQSDNGENFSKLHLDERQESASDEKGGAVSGSFVGTWSDGQYTGTWTSRAGKALPFRFSAIPFINDTRTSPSWRTTVSYPDFQDTAVTWSLLKHSDRTARIKPSPNP